MWHKIEKEYVIIFTILLGFLVLFNYFDNEFNYTGQVYREIDKNEITGYSLIQDIKSFFLRIIGKQNVVGEKLQESISSGQNKQGLISAIKEYDQESKGYIIQFKRAPLIAKVELINKDIQQSKQVLKPITQDIIDHRNKIKTEHSTFKSRLGLTFENDPLIKSVAEPSQVKILAEYEKVFNGIALDISEQEIQKIKDFPEVKNVYPNYIVKAILYESIPLINADKVWKLDRNGNDCSINERECLTGKNVKIAIIDTGVDYTHPDLGGCFGEGCKVAGGYDFFNNDNDPIDDHGHGTHVAATAAGKSIIFLPDQLVSLAELNNGGGGAGGGGIPENKTIILNGVAPDAFIYAYKVLDEYGSGSMDGVIEGIERAIDPNQDGDFSDHVDVISMSLGGYGNPDDPLSQAVDTAADLGVISVVAAGNSGPYEETIGSPGTARKAITVGASHKFDRVAEFSSRGPVIWDDKIIIKPDLVAPGVSICAAQWDSWLDERLCLDDNHIAISGTSMATPHVSGAVALLKQKHPGWTPEEVKYALRSKAFGLSENIFVQGYGRLDVLNAINFNGIPSIAEITTSGNVNENFNITGTAKGREFSKYILYYGKGKNPEQWQIIKEDNIPVENNILYENFNPNQLAEGHNILRLDVYNTNNEVSQDRNLIIVDNIDIKEPKNNDIYRIGDRINIVGTITGNFDNYTVEYKIGEKPEIWYDNGISLTNDGKEEVKDSIIATWDTNIIIESNYYTIRISIYQSDGTVNYEYIENIYLDKTLRKGWPQKINWDFESWDSEKSKNVFAITDLKNNIVSVLPKKQNFYRRIYDLKNKESKQGFIELNNDKLLKNYNSILNVTTLSANGYYYWAGVLEAVVDDVNNDGKKEIFVYAGGNPTKIYAYNEDGSFLKSWPVEVDDVDLPGGNIGAPSIADIDNDGFKDIIVNGFDKLYIYKYDGSLLRTISLSIVSQPTTETVVTDLDNDGRVEIIKKYDDFLDDPYIGQRVAVLDSFGNMKTNWPQVTYDLRHDGWYYGCGLFGAGESTPAVGNLDNDGKKEVIVASIRNVFDDGFDPEDFDTYDKWHCEGRVYAFKNNGTILKGFPVDIDGVIFASPVVVDLNNDGYKEIVITTMFSKDPNNGVYVIDKNGKILNGWPQLKGQWTWASPSVIDINNDGFLEIMISDLIGDNYLFDYNGNVLQGWPQETTWANFRTLISGDINQDYIPDVIDVAGNGFYPSIDKHGGVYAWNKDGSLINGFPKVTETDAQAGPTVEDINKDGKTELIASSDWDYDFIKGEDKFRGSVYVWDLNTNFNRETMHWPMFMRDTQHTSEYKSLKKGSTIPEITVLNPNGGEYIRRFSGGASGSTSARRNFYIIKWNSNLPKNTKINIKLLKNDKVDKIIAKNVLESQTKNKTYSWDVSKASVGSKYKILIDCVYPNRCTPDKSDSTFTII